MAYTPGPKELALRAMRENKASRKPSPSELRKQIAKTKPAKVQRKGGRGR